MKRIIILICFISAIFLSCQKKHDEKIINKDMSNIITTENMPKIKERETYKVERIKSLLEKGIETKDKYWSGQTALILASEYGYSGIINSLIEAGADVNIRDQEYDKTPLIIASEDAYIDMMKILIEAGADVNAKDGFNKERASLSAYGQTPLMYVVNKSSIEGIKMLISAGADVNAKDHFGKTSLSIARKYDDKEIINILEKSGAK